MKLVNPEERKKMQAVWKTLRIYIRLQKKSVLKVNEQQKISTNERRQNSWKLT